MKVRPSVKPICEKCKIIKRKGSRDGDLRKTPSIAEAGLMFCAGANRIRTHEICRADRIRAAFFLTEA